jgi:nifR3 family TIM-barrel protein
MGATVPLDGRRGPSAIGEGAPAKREIAPLEIGPLRIDPPVVLAPMAGVTNAPFRRLCRELGAGLYVSEMVTARPLAEGREKTVRLAGFGPDEWPRSLQLYGTDPAYVGLAVTKLVAEGAVDHLDLNFGCPVRKVTRMGGGAAIPAKPRLLRDIIRAAVSNAGKVPVTVKCRLGIDDTLLTFLDTGRIAEDEGCAAIGLHARTAAQLYDGQADWERIAELKQAVSIPVLGNGDIWVAEDAVRMIRQTGCDGVIVGRGCLGRPWLFRDLAAALHGETPKPPPTLGEVADIMLRHGRELIDWFGDERAAMLAFRKHSGWYTKGFRNSSVLRSRLMEVVRYEQLEAVLATVDREEPFPDVAHRASRGKRRGTQRVVLPPGFLDDREDRTPPDPRAEDPISGG